jgi:hypothetical protein
VKGATGGSMGGRIVQTAGLKDRNNETCPVCQSVAREPCRKVLKGGKLGGYQRRMHRRRLILEVGRV